jgi:hypothetical protein
MELISMYTGRSYQCIYRGIYTMKLVGLLETENSKNKEEINIFFFFEYK